MFADFYSLRCQAIIPGTDTTVNVTPSTNTRSLCQELQSMNIAARLYTTSTGRIRD